MFPIDLNTLMINLGLYVIIEIIANTTLFPFLNKFYGVQKHKGEKISPWFKGVIERICLSAGLLLGFSHILVAFGALKIGTKLGGQSTSTDDKTSTEYYLVGNLLSILIVFLFIFLKNLNIASLLR